MAPAWRVLVQRDGTSTANGSNSTDEGVHLSTGAIIGIACGAGALFLGSIILFIIYWRKQKRYDDEENYYSGGGHFNTSSAAPVYTLDYKGDEPVMATPQTSHTGQSGFTPLVEMASAMPTHPAYIPRALVRQNGSEKGSLSAVSSPMSGTTSHFSSISSRQYRQKTELDMSRRDTPDRKATTQSYEEYESDSVTAAEETQPQHGHRGHPSVGTGIPGPIPVPVPAPTMPANPGGRRKQYSPPRLNLNTQTTQHSKYINLTAPPEVIPSKGKVPIKAVDISGPLAFPPQPAPPPPPPIQLGGPRQQQEHHQQYQKELEIQLQLEQQDQRHYAHRYYEESSSGATPDTYSYGNHRGGPPQRGRSFRDRSLSSRGGTSRSRSNRGDRSDVDPYYYTSSSAGGRQGQQYQHQQYQQRPTHYEEVEIGRNSDDDIW